MKEDYNNSIQEQLRSRKTDKLHSNCTTGNDADVIILKASCDIGVARNGGRRGTSFGPSAICNGLLSMSNHNKSHKIKVVETKSNSSLEFSKMQEYETQNLLKEIKDHKSIIHLGGGHDHIYPLLMSINKTQKDILVINLDAHLDTRTDQSFHSGTPFRQFANNKEGSFHLIQIGIHDYANAKSNFEELGPSSSMEVYTTDEFNSILDFDSISSKLDKLVENYKGHKIVLSLDCDAIESQTMEAVSAVNHNGLSVKTVNSIFNWYKGLDQKNIIGIYEYNPIYDNLSQKGSRYIASLIERFV